MKTLIYYFLVLGLVFSCSSTKNATTVVQNSNENVSEDSIVRIANDELEYEIIIFDPGFNTWLKSTAKQEGYYTQEFLENRNRQYVNEWNNRVLQSNRYNRNLYEMRIDYDPTIDYGYDVNYKLYNYFIYFQLTYNQKLAGYVPRI